MRSVRFFVLSMLCLTSLAGVAHADGGVIAGRLPGSDTPIAVRDARPASRGYSAREIAQLRRHLAARRQLMIRRLRAYGRAGIFPANHVEPGRLNIFIDADGHLCAAANLIARDGRRDLVDAQARSNNFVRLIDVHDGELYRWMLASGLTQEEIDAIQEPYMFTGSEPIEPVEPTEPPPVLVWNQQDEARRLQAHFRAIERQLTRNTRASLNAAVARYLAAGLPFPS